MDDDAKPKPLPVRKQAFAERERDKGKGLFHGKTPQGTGPTNRHGMPRLPPGQRAVEKWPVLDLGDVPAVDLGAWRLEVDGLVERPLSLSWEQFLALPQTDDVSDFHCVTTWSKMDMSWRGVRVRDLIALAGPLPAASHVFVTAYDEDPSSGDPYTTNVSLADATEPDVLLVHTWDGAPLPLEHGGPCRMITPRLYAWKGAKWVRRLSLRDHDERGFWERRGYSNTAIPWFDDRYSRR
jgi:DMSO/TMAO reductase YedYZ molybdopterin-dependent catalytic subunit